MTPEKALIPNASQAERPEGRDSKKNVGGDGSGPRTQPTTGMNHCGAAVRSSERPPGDMHFRATAARTRPLRPIGSRHPLPAPHCAGCGASSAVCTARRDVFLSHS